MAPERLYKQCKSNDHVLLKPSLKHDLVLATEGPGGNLMRRINTNVQHITWNKAITIDNLKHNLMKK